MLVHLARACLAASESVQAWLAADEAVAVARRCRARVPEGLALLVRAQVRRALGEGRPVVAADLHAAPAVVDTTGALAYEPFIREDLARLHGDEHSFMRRAGPSLP